MKKQESPGFSRGEHVNEQTCTIPNCGPADDDGRPEPRLATHGLVCDWHYRRFTRTLHEIPERYAELETMSADLGIGEHSERSAKYREPPAPLNLNVVAMRDPRTAQGDDDDLVPVHGTLAGWCRIVAEERPTSLPSDDVTSMTNHLHRHAGWMAEQDWFSEAYREVSEAMRSLRLVTGWQPKQRIGACYLYDGDEQCGGDLIQTPATLEVECKKCRQTWPTARDRAILAIALNSSSEYSTSTSGGTGSASAASG